VLPAFGSRLPRPISRRMSAPTAYVPDSTFFLHISFLSYARGKKFIDDSSRRANVVVRA
jgi:hypothetical protein